MNLEICADIVRKSDPDRFLATMTAAPDQRAKLFAIYAFNVEVAHLPWVSGEPMIAEMRLQWWLDEIATVFKGNSAPPHEVMTPLAQVIGEIALKEQGFAELIEARRWDVYCDPFEDLAGLQNYLKATSGNLMGMAAQALGANDEDTKLARDYGAATGLAGFLQAVPELMARGRRPLPDERSEILEDLAKDALVRMDQAAKCNPTSKVLPALLAATQARPILEMVAKQPQRVLEGRLGRSEFRRKGRLLMQSVLGRW